MCVSGIMARFCATRCNTTVDSIEFGCTEKMDCYNFLDSGRKCEVKFIKRCTKPMECINLLCEKIFLKVWPVYRVLEPCPTPLPEKCPF